MHNPSQVMIRAADMDDCEVIIEFNRRLAEESEGKSLESSHEVVMFDDHSESAV